MEAMIASATHLLYRIFSFRVNKKSDLRNYSRYSLWFTQISNIRHWVHLTFRIFHWENQATRYISRSQSHASRIPVAVFSLSDPAHRVALAAEGEHLRLKQGP